MMNTYKTLAALFITASLMTPLQADDNRRDTSIWKQDQTHCIGGRLDGEEVTFGCFRKTVEDTITTDSAIKQRGDTIIHDTMQTREIKQDTKIAMGSRFSQP